MQRCRSFVAVVFFLGCSLLGTFAAATAGEGVRTRLFNGQNLDGWQVTGCDVGVEDGKLVLKGGDGFVRTNETHRDFVLELDWRARREAKYDSGIYIRSALPEEGKPWPARYQVNLLQGGEGNLLGLKGDQSKAAQSKGLVKANDWNHFKLTVVGDTAALEINGQPAWKASGLEAPEGYIGFQSEVDGGGQFEFRNVELTDLDYKPLFNGQDLTGWTGDTKGYFVENGSLVSRENSGGKIFTTGEYSDFSLRFDFKLTEGGNNGVGIRSPLEGDPAYVAMEIQVLDDTSPRYRTIAPWQHHGSIYGVVASKPGHLKPLGEWNHEEIIANGSKIKVILNGVTIVDADLAKVNGTLDGKDHPGVNRSTGHIGFLGHGAKIEFANIRIRELNKK